MKITKYAHACFTVEKAGTLLVVDPGAYTTDLPALESVIAILITHEHADHFDSTALGAIIAHNPNATVYAHQSITSQLGNTLPTTAVSVGECISVGPFTVDFIGGEHAVIHPTFPSIPNLGIMINDSLYYPGDSYVLPDKAVDTLALPVAAPWMKMSEAFDFLLAVKPRLVFPTHDAILSSAGMNLVDRMTQTFAHQVGATYERLSAPIDING
ncbi:MBL fold metallo-hydrolase [Candidatus Saccharibacteria bacterium]|nr:MBL fold metallo-hydrolase [Candidatus Saccharibacteria bacterium]